MKITDIKQQVKTPGRYSIFIDGKFSFGLSELGLINSKIRIGHEITKEELEVYKSDAHTDKIYNLAIALIARRPRSEGEITDYLKRKKVEPEEVTKILNMLSNNRLVDDMSFAESWVESRRLLKSTSKRKLSLELKQKRISDEIIRTVIGNDETDEIEVLQTLIAKKKTQSRYQDPVKLMQYLARQGFRYDDIKAALHED